MPLFPDLVEFIIYVPNVVAVRVDDRTQMKCFTWLPGRSQQGRLLLSSSLRESQCIQSFGWLLWLFPRGISLENQLLPCVECSLLPCLLELLRPDINHSLGNPTALATWVGGVHSQSFCPCSPRLALMEQLKFFSSQYISTLQQRKGSWLLQDHQWWDSLPLFETIFRSRLFPWWPFHYLSLGCPTHTYLYLSLGCPMHTTASKCKYLLIL